MPDAATAGRSSSTPSRNPGLSTRLASVDALRGMTVAAMLLVNDPGDWGHVYAPLLHAQWHGFTPTDLVFPMFLFIVGVSIALALTQRVDQGVAPGALVKPLLGRSLRIIAFGLLLNVCGLWASGHEFYRIPGVLQRIGVCFAFTGLVALYLPSRRVQWGLIVALLAGYGALLASGGTYEPYVNLASRIDDAVLGAHVYLTDAATGRHQDPEGLLSTLGALATTLLGLRAGDWLRQRRVMPLLIAGVVCLGLGFAWDQWQPINKNLWTSSFVLWTAGWSFLALTLCHALIDRAGWRPLGRTFGVNAIAAYGGSALMALALKGFGWSEPIYQTAFAGWMTPLFGPYVPSLAFALSFVLVWWLAMRWLDLRRIYFKI